MKVIILSLLLVGCAISSATPAYQLPEEGLQDKLSVEGRVQLRKSAFRMLAELCLGDESEPSIYEAICKPALKIGTGANAPSTMSCMSCPVADPICMASCPQ